MNFLPLDKKYLLWLLLVLFFHQELALSSVHAEYGDIIMNRNAESMRKAGVKDVLFPHWFHRIRFKCTVCHEAIFDLREGATEINMNLIKNGQKCGICHNGYIAWEPIYCERCHSRETGWFPGVVQYSKKRTEEAPKPDGHVVVDNWRPPAITRSGLPLDRFKLVDWNKAIKEGIISPLWSLDPAKKPEDQRTIDLDILFEGQSDSIENVLFSHKAHTWWINCQTCHNTKGGAIFAAAPDKNFIKMKDMSKGKWCGRCHNKVSFSLADCIRCHTVPKGVVPPGAVVRQMKKFVSSKEGLPK